VANAAAILIESKSRHSLLTDERRSRNVALARHKKRGLRRRRNRGGQNRMFLNRFAKLYRTIGGRFLRERVGN